MIRVGPIGVEEINTPRMTCQPGVAKLSRCIGIHYQICLHRGGVTMPNIQSKIPSGCDKTGIHTRPSNAHFISRVRNDVWTLILKTKRGNPIAWRPTSVRLPRLIHTPEVGQPFKPCTTKRKIAVLYEAWVATRDATRLDRIIQRRGANCTGTWNPVDFVDSTIRQTRS